MDQARRLTADTFAKDGAPRAPASQGHGPQHDDTVVVLAPAAYIAPARQTPHGVPTPSKDWPSLLERVRGAAHHMRTIESRAQEQEFRVQELLEQVRADMQDAHARIQVAEQRARDVQAQANKMVQAAEDRARVAQERIVTLEGWLVQISETIDTEFARTPGDVRGTGTERR